MSLVALLLWACGSAQAPVKTPDIPAAIAWPEFFASVSARGLVYSEKLRSLEGRRVVLRGYAITHPRVPGGILLSRDPYSDPDDVEESDVPYDAVGVRWRAALAIPTPPSRPTVEGTLRLGNHELGDQIVAILLDDAVPVVAPAARNPHSGRLRAAHRETAAPVVQ